MTTGRLDPSDRNIVLTGFMGTGKTTSGESLAHRLNFEFVDTDRLIEQRHGPVPDLFRDRGEGGFRSLEREITAELGDLERTVISTGGGLVLDPANTAALSRRGRVFCLTASPEQIVERVTHGPNAGDRPLLSGDDPTTRVAHLLGEREWRYRQFVQVSTEALTPDEVAAELVALVRAEPERSTVGAGGDSFELVVGVAVLPMLCDLVPVDGPMTVIVDPRGPELIVASLPPPDHLMFVDEWVPLTEFEVQGGTTIVTVGGARCAKSGAGLAARAASDCSLVHIPIDPLDQLPQLAAITAADLPTLQTVVVDVSTVQLAMESSDSAHIAPADLQRLVQQAVDL